MSPDQIRGILLELSKLAAMSPPGDSVSRILERIASDLRYAGEDEERQRSVIREILTLYQGGMGSFQDYVLQDSSGVRPEHQRFDDLRRRLFVAAVEKLR
ncbi:DUF6966 domain-containing protein [Rhizomonospora bruguierae]|uniref:DUF6966 domain-containing protein n=1 Tax=Rhizomonospora bruguierae TaxID=1581705 RepID=UPI0035E43F47